MDLQIITADDRMNLHKLVNAFIRKTPDIYIKRINYDVKYSTSSGKKKEYKAFIYYSKKDNNEKFFNL